MHDDLEDVLRRAATRDRDALTVLFRQHHAPLLRFLRALEPRVADDLAGEVWLAVAQRLAGFRGDERAFRAWLFAIARRRLADHRRTAARRPLHLVPVEDLHAREGGTDPAETATGAVSAQEAIARLTRALPPDQAEIVLLRVVAGLSVDEVARLTGKTPGAVRVAQHRALARLGRLAPPRLAATATHHPA